MFFFWFLVFGRSIADVCGMTNGVGPTIEMEIVRSSYGFASFAYASFSFRIEMRNDECRKRITARISINNKLQCRLDRPLSPNKTNEFYLFAPAKIIFIDFGCSIRSNYIHFICFSLSQWIPTSVFDVNRWRRLWFMCPMLRTVTSRRNVKPSTPIFASHSILTNINFCSFFVRHRRFFLEPMDTFRYSRGIITVRIIVLVEGSSLALPEFTARPVRHNWFRYRCFSKWGGLLSSSMHTMNLSSRPKRLVLPHGKPPN